MTVTIAGRLTDNMGVSRHEDVTSATAPGGRLIARSDVRFVSLPADKYLDRQPATIPLDLHHRDVVGEVLYIERGASGLHIVATSGWDELSDVDVEMYLSPSVEFRVDSRGGAVESGVDALIEGVALCTHPATYGQRPVSVFVGDLRSAEMYARCRPQLRHTADVLDRAVQYHRRHRHGDAHVINLEPRLAAQRAAAATVPKGPMRYSGGGEILAIR